MTAEKTFPKVTNDIAYASEYNAIRIVNLEAGENLTAGNVVYIKKNDGKVYVSDTGTADDIRADGVCITTTTSGNTAPVQLCGNYVTSGLTADEVYYLGASGAVSTTQSGVQVGVATSTTNLHIHIVQDDRDAIGTIKPFLSNITGYPSNNITAFWILCDGTTISDAESPFNGQAVPDLNGTGNAIRAADTAGGTASQSISTTNLSGHLADGNNYNHNHGATNYPMWHDAVYYIKIK